MVGLNIDKMETVEKKLPKPNFGEVNQELVKVNTEEIRDMSATYLASWLEEVREEKYQWANAFHHLAELYADTEQINSELLEALKLFVEPGSNKLYSEFEGHLTKKEQRQVEKAVSNAEAISKATQ